MSEAEALAGEIGRSPHLMVRLAENSLTVAENLRGNYFKNTAAFVAYLKSQKSVKGDDGRPLLKTFDASQAAWGECRDEVVTFIDGGLGRVEIASRAPILLRVGSYRVKVGERDLQEREQFGYYPVILGDLEGGSRERKDFIDVVRITAELLGALAALDREPELRVLMLHGPLIYQVSRYAGHTPFTEGDIDLFLRQYADGELGRAIKEDFLREARLDLYPRMVPSESDEWVRKRVFEPLTWLAFLHRRLIARAKMRNPVPIVAGVVERGDMRQLSHEILERLFRRMRIEDRLDRLNELFGRSDLTDPESFLNATNYTDGLLLHMLLETGQGTESWKVRKYEGFRKDVEIRLPGEANKRLADFTGLNPANGDKGFPVVNGLYVKVLDNAEPLRVETYSDLKPTAQEAARRVHLYARLLPGYGFPVGLDVADKYAKVPAWLTSAYEKMIRHHLGQTSISLGLAVGRQCPSGVCLQP